MTYTQEENLKVCTLLPPLIKDYHKQLQQIGDQWINHFTIDEAGDLLFDQQGY